MQRIRKGDAPDDAFGAVCLALHSLGRIALAKAAEGPMRPGDLDRVLESIDDAPAIPAMCVAMDLVSGVDGYGAVRLAQLKIAADDGARRIVRKYQATGAPLQYGASIAKSVYGVPAIQAMRYSQRLDNDPRAQYGPVSKALGMDEVLNWAMLSAQAERGEIAKAVEEDDFFVMRGGERKETSRMRDTETGRFVGTGQAGAASEDDDDDFFAQVARRKSMPLASAGAEREAPVQARIMQAKREVEDEQADEEIAEAEAEQQELASMISELESMSAERERMVGQESTQAAMAAFREKQQGQYRKLQAHRAAVGRMKERQKGAAQTRADFQADLKVAQFDAELAQKNAEAAQWIRDRGKAMSRVNTQMNSAEQANMLIETLKQSMAQSEERTKALKAEKAAKKAAEEEEAKAKKIKRPYVRSYNFIAPDMSSVPVDLGETFPWLNITVQAPMLLSRDDNDTPDPVDVVAMYSGFDKDIIRTANESEQKVIRETVVEVRDMSYAFKAMHEELNVNRSKHGTTVSGQGINQSDRDQTGGYMALGSTRARQPEQKIYRYGPRVYIQQFLQQIRLAPVTVGGQQRYEEMARNRSVQRISDTFEDVPNKVTQYYNDEQMFLNMIDTQSGVTVPLDSIVNEQGTTVNDAYAQYGSEVLVADISEKLEQFSSLEEAEGRLNPRSYAIANLRAINIADALAASLEVAKEIGDEQSIFEVEKVARAYAIYGTALSNNTYGDIYRFLPRYDTKALISFVGTDAGGQPQTETIEVWASQMSEAPSSIQETIETSISQFNGGRIDNAAVTYTVEQEGFDLSMGDMSDPLTPKRSNRYGVLADNEEFWDRSAAVNLLHHLGHSLLIPTSYAKEMSEKDPVSYKKLMDLRSSPGETYHQEDQVISDYRYGENRDWVPVKRPLRNEDSNDTDE